MAWADKKTERWAEHPRRPTVTGGLSAFSLHGYARAWKAFFRWCQQQGYLAHDPTSVLQVPPLPEQPPKAVLPDDLAQLLAAHDHPRDYALICFLADTGCRVGGLVNLRLADVNLEEGFAIVREKGYGGQHKARKVYMKLRTVEALRRYLGEQPREAEQPVFGGQRGPLTESGVFQRLKCVAQHAQVAGRSNPHAFRHGFVRGALENGADLSTVAQLAGHCNVDVTARFYARWTDAELKEKHDRVSWLPAD